MMLVKKVLLGTLGLCWPAPILHKLYGKSQVQAYHVGYGDFLCHTRYMLGYCVPIGRF